MEQEHGLYCLLRATWISTISSVMNTHRKRNHLGSRSSISLVARSLDPASASSCENGTLIICIPWIIKGPWIPRGRLFGLFSGVPSKRNTYQKGTLIKRNTHQKGRL